MRALFVVFVVSFITGCVNNANVDTNQTFWQHKPNTVVIVTTHANKPEYVDENAGSRGAIIGMVNMLMTQQLQTHLGQMDLNGYYQDLALQFQQALAKENIKAVVANEHPYLDPDLLNLSNKVNRVQLAAEYNADQVLVLAMPFYGARTPMQGNIFASIPPVEGVCVLYAELSDPQHTTIYWRHTSRVTKPVVNANQPPDYPNLTQAILDSQKMAQEELLDSLRSGR